MDVKIASLIVMLFISSIHAGIITLKEYSPSNGVCSKTFVNIWVDCNSKEVHVRALDVDGNPISGGEVYLLFGSMIDKSELNKGNAVLHYFGKNELITYPFGVRIEHQNFCSKFIEYSIDECKEGASSFIVIDESPPSSGDGFGDSTNEQLFNDENDTQSQDESQYNSSNAQNISNNNSNQSNRSVGNEGKTAHRDTSRDGGILAFVIKILNSILHMFGFGE